MIRTFSVGWSPPKLHLVDMDEFNEFMIVGQLKQGCQAYEACYLAGSTCLILLRGNSKRRLDSHVLIGDAQFTLSPGIQNERESNFFELEDGDRITRSKQLIL